MKKSEHGRFFSEPGNRASDKSKRIESAEKWTYDTLKPLLIFWKEKCPCYGYDFFYIIDEITYDL